MTGDTQPAGTPGTPDPASAFFADPIDRRRAERRHAAQEYAAWLATMTAEERQAMREADEATAQLSLEGADWDQRDHLSDRPNAD
jgi:hypothetical protein